MKELRERELVCQKCPNLASARKNVVFGVGDINAALMFVGEAPGADEDAQARPFVGRAGQLLTKIIESLGLKREEIINSEPSALMRATLPSRLPRSWARQRRRPSPRS